MKFFLMIFSFMTNQAFALEAQVIVLEAPLLQSPAMNSKVVQLVRKGDKIYLPPEYDFANPNLPTYNPDHDFKSIPDNGFYQTIDKNGSLAYIPAKYVKVIWKDEREMSQDISPFNHDPTDYRIAEPLQENYPFIPKEKFKTIVSLIYGPDQKVNYDYGSTITDESFSNRYGLELGWFNKVSWDPYDRFYFGGLATIYTSQATFQLFDDRKIEEARGVLGLGPSLTYDVHRNEDERFTLLSAIMINYHRSIINQESTSSGDKEERIFTGYSYGPKFSALYSFRNTFPQSDFFIGLDMQMLLPYNLTTQTEATISELWGTEDNNTIYHPMSFVISLNLGIISWN